MTNTTKGLAGPVPNLLQGTNLASQFLTFSKPYQL